MFSRLSESFLLSFICYRTVDTEFYESKFNQIYFNSNYLDYKLEFYFLIS